MARDAPSLGLRSRPDVRLTTLIGAMPVQWVCRPWHPDCS
jgi:hypothetical protein